MRPPSFAAASMISRRSLRSSARMSASVWQTGVMTSICEASISDATSSSPKACCARCSTRPPRARSSRVSESTIWYSSSAPKVYSSICAVSYLLFSDLSEDELPAASPLSPLKGSLHHTQDYHLAQPADRRGTQQSLRRFCTLQTSLRAVRRVALKGTAVFSSLRTQEQEKTLRHERGPRSMAQGNDGGSGLVKLEDFEGELEEHWQDAQGLKVLDKNGDEIGTVEDLYVYEDAQAVHILKVEIEGH